MAQIRINVSDEEHRLIKTRCAASGEYMSDVGRRLLIDYAGGLDVEKPLLDLCLEVSDYLGKMDRNFEDNDYSMRLQAAVDQHKATQGQGEEA